MQQIISFFLYAFAFLATFTLASHRHHSLPEDMESIPVPHEDELIALVEQLTEKHASGRHPRYTRGGRRNDSMMPIHPIEAPKISSEEDGKRFLRKYCQNGKCKLPKTKQAQVQKSQVKKYRTKNAHVCNKCGKDHHKLTASESAGLRVLGQARDRMQHHVKAHGRGHEEEGDIIVKPVKSHKKALRKGGKSGKTIKKEIILVKRKGKGKGKDHPCFEVNQINLHVDVDVKQQQAQQEKQGIVQVGKIKGGHHHRHHHHHDDGHGHKARRVPLNPSIEHDDNGQIDSPSRGRRHMAPPGNMVYGHGHQRGHGYVRHPSRATQKVQMIKARRAVSDEEEIPYELEPTPPGDRPGEDKNKPWRKRLDRLRRRFNDAIDRIGREIGGRTGDSDVERVIAKTPKHRQSHKWIRQLRRRIAKWRKHFEKETTGTKIALLLSLSVIITMQIAVIAKLLAMARGAYQGVPSDEEYEKLGDGYGGHNRRHSFDGTFMEKC
jgi:hypothetical protein